MQAQTPNPNIPPTGSVYLQRIVSSYDVSPTWETVLPTLIPLVAIALAASHGFIVLRWVIEGVAERLLWRGSAEEVEVQKLLARGKGGEDEQASDVAGGARKQYGRDEKREGGVFWNGGEEGARAIGSVGKSE